jgi:hypothetical protein
MKSIILLIILVVVASPCFGQKKSNKKPFVLKLIEKPVELKAGQSYTFIFEVHNTSKVPLTLSSKCATAVTLTWEYGDGTGGGTGAGCGGGSIVVSHSYDPVTKKIIGVSQIYPYSEDDFFTLPPNGTKQFEAELKVPEDIEVKLVNVHIRFESEYDGKAIGIKAWTGSASYITLRMRVLK